jgi:hypothetical protein
MNSLEPTFYTEFTSSLTLNPFLSYDRAKVSLNTCLTTLQQQKVPGPWLFRDSEFAHLLGGGALFNVYGCTRNTVELDNKTLEGQIWQKSRMWAIKRVRKNLSPSMSTQRNGLPISIERHIEATIIEAQVLSYRPFRDHPNLVKLLGWGLCLDDLEDENWNIRIPHLILEKAECTLDTLLQRQSVYLSKKRQLCIDISEGLRALHDASIAHGVCCNSSILLYDTYSFLGLKAPEYINISKANRQ